MSDADRQEWARRAWRNYLRRYRRFRWALVGSVVLLATQSMVVASVALFVKMIFDDLLLKRPLGALFAPSGAILFFVTLSGLLSRTARQQVLRITKIVIAELRHELLIKSYELSNFFAATSDRTLLHSLIVHDTERVDIMSNAIVAFALPALLTSAVLSAALLVFTPMLFLVTVCVIATALVVNRYLGNRLKLLVEQFNKTFETFSQGILATLRRMELTRAMGAERLEVAQRTGQVAELRLVSANMALAATTYNVAQMSVTALVTLSTLVVGGSAVLSGGMSLSALAAYYVIVSQLAAAMNIFWNAVPQILSGHKSLIDIDRTLRRTDAVPKGGERVCRLKGKIEFRSVQFSYGDVPVLKDLSLHVAPGEKVVITGANGAGKSTLALLLLGLYGSQRGSILVDDTPLDDLSLAHFRQQLGVVLQEPYLFAGTVAENISYGKSDVDIPCMTAAAKLTGADAFIRSLPNGYDTIIGAGGTSLSGGQSQLIALTRALLGMPRVLILDEPTNHLDSSTAAALCDALQNLEYQPTILLITHDKEIAAGFGRTYRLEYGKLLESGTCVAKQDRMLSVGSSVP